MITEEVKNEALVVEEVSKDISANRAAMAPISPHKRIGGIGQTPRRPFDAPLWPIHFSEFEVIYCCVKTLISRAIGTHMDFTIDRKVVFSFPPPYPWTNFQFRHFPVSVLSVRCCVLCFVCCVVSATKIDKRFSRDLFLTRKVVFSLRN